MQLTIIGINKLIWTKVPHVIINTFTGLFFFQTFFVLLVGIHVGIYHQKHYGRNTLNIIGLFGNSLILFSVLALIIHSFLPQIIKN